MSGTPPTTPSKYPSVSQELKVNQCFFPLARFRANNVPIIKGWLYKKGESGLSQTKKRWFHLAERFFLYYSKEPDGNTKYSNSE